MRQFSILAHSLSPLLLVASCGSAAPGDTPSEPASGSAPSSETGDGLTFEIIEHGTYDEPWSVRFIPGTEIVVVTEKGGALRGRDLANGKALFFTGVPQVDYGGQGGLGDVAFLKSEADSPLSGRTIYLSWAEAGSGSTRGAAVGRGKLLCEDHQSCEIRDMRVIWRQSPKVSGRGHYSHRIRFSPDEQYMFVSSGERQKGDPAQDTSNTLGTIVRLNLDGSPAAGNPLEDRGSPSDQIWSWGHRNMLGLDFDAQGNLWEVEHGPRGGDELNLVRKGQNYGWPLRSNGVNYDGSPIPDHAADDGFAQPAASWSPVIAPGDMVIYRGDLFPALKGDAVIAGLKSKTLVLVSIDGSSARETERHDMGERIRSITEGPNGALWVVEDGRNARLLELRPG